MWRGVATDDFARHGEWTPEWAEPTAADLGETLCRLLAEADRALAGADRS